jgi:hypothetical protein
LQNVIICSLILALVVPRILRLVDDYFDAPSREQLLQGRLAHGAPQQGDLRSLSDAVPRRTGGHEGLEAHGESPPPRTPGTGGPPRACRSASCAACVTVPVGQARAQAAGVDTHLVDQTLDAPDPQVPRSVLRHSRWCKLWVACTNLRSVRRRRLSMRSSPRPFLPHRPPSPSWSEYNRLCVRWCHSTDVKRQRRPWCAAPGAARECRRHSRGRLNTKSNRSIILMTFHFQARENRASMLYNSVLLSVDNRELPF